MWIEHIAGMAHMRWLVALEWRWHPGTQIGMKTNSITDGKAKFKPAPDQVVISYHPLALWLLTGFGKCLEILIWVLSTLWDQGNGMGISWFMQTNALKYVNSFTIVPFPGSTSSNPLHPSETSEWIMQERLWRFITSRQRSRDWFMMRNFSKPAQEQITA